MNTGKKLREIQTETVQARLELLEVGSTEALRLQSELLKLEREGIDDNLKATEDAEKAKQAAVQETARTLQQSIQLLQQSLRSVISDISAISQARQEAIQQELESLDANREALQRESERRVLDFERQLLEGEITQEQKDAAVEAERAALEEQLLREQIATVDRRERLRQEAEQEEEKAERVRQAQERLSAAIAAAEAVSAAAKGVSAIAEQAKLPFPANVAAIIATVAAVAAAITSLRRLFAESGGLIANDENVLYMESGGPVIRRSNRKRKVRRVVRGDRINIGKSHRRGGILTELEKGEYVQPVESTSMFLPQLQWMADQGNKRKRGKPYSTVFPSNLFPTTDTPAANPVITRPPMVRTDIRPITGGYAQDGGLAVADTVTETNTTASRERQKEAQLTNDLLEAMLEKLGDLETAVEENREVVFSIRKFQSAQARLNFENDITQS